MTWDGCDAADQLRPWCRDIRKHVAGGRGWLITGPVGTGKSSAAGLVAIEAVKAGLSVRWEHVPAMLDTMEDRGSRRDAFWRQKHADLLVWDDFPVDGLSPWQVDLLDRIVEHRYSSLRATVVTANVPIALLAGDQRIARFVDRWRERMAGIEIGGQSKRKKT